MCRRHYGYFRERGIPADILSSECELSKYDLVIAPMLYLLRDGVADKLREYVSGGGTLVTTYLTGYVDKEDLCWLGGFPGGGLRELLGIWAEEIDSLYSSDRNSVTFKNGFTGTYEVTNFCELIHAETAEVIAEYDSDFYAGMPAATCNHFGSGKVYHLAAHVGSDALRYFYDTITSPLCLRRALPTEVPENIQTAYRTDGEYDYIFLMNFSQAAVTVPLESGKMYQNLLTNTFHTQTIPLTKYETAVLKVKK